MHMAKRLLQLLISVVAIFMILPRNVDAYDDPTHRAIARTAVSVSSLPSYLRNRLAFTRGIQEEFLGQSAERWITSGARARGQV
jgi:hypothetical protein